MGVPFISLRKHYRLVPGESIEPTSTIVLQSKDAYFVDIRIITEDHHKENHVFTGATLQWAFAGRSRNSKETKNENGELMRWHTVWDHWIDNQSDAAVSDEADMRLQEDGLVLEEGVNVDTHTGLEQKYEEMWEDLPVEAFGKKGNKSSIVVRGEDPGKRVKGLVVKVGGWCQGILKDEEQLTAERWRRREQTELLEDCQGVTRQKNWDCVYRIGNGVLPCETICEKTDGKTGATSVMQSDDNDIEWRVVEEYYY